MNLTKTKNRKGFTLIELLVTVSIIAVLSGLLLGVINIQGLRQKARDSQRVADLKKIQVALEAYLADHRTYPPTGTPATWENTTGGNILTEIVPNYLSNFPDDPLSTAFSKDNPCDDTENHRYNYVSDGSRYILTAIMEVSSSNDDSPCHTVSNWGYPSDNVWGCSSGYETEGVCYGVQNP